MSEERRFSRELKLAALARMEAGENVSALAREPKVRREHPYQWGDGFGRAAAPSPFAPVPCVLGDGRFFNRDLQAHWRRAARLPFRRHKGRTLHPDELE
jgi:transposase-like protein